MALFRHQLAGERVDDRAGELLSGDAARKVQFFVVFVAAHAGEVVTARVKEQAVDVGLCALNGGGLARAQLPIDFEERLFHVLAGVLFDGCVDAVVVAEVLADLLVTAQTQSADKDCHGDLAVLIDADIEHIIGVVFVFQPRAAVRNNGGAEQFLAGLVILHLVIDAGRTNQLGYDDALRAIDHKGAAFRHQREIAHKDLGFLDLSTLLVQEAGGHPECSRIGGVALLALFHAIVRLVDIQFVVHKIEDQIARIVRNP